MAIYWCIMNAQNILQAMNQGVNLPFVAPENERVKSGILSFNNVKETLKYCVCKYVLCSEIFGSVDCPEAQNILYFAISKKVTKSNVVTL